MARRGALVIWLCFQLLLVPFSAVAQLPPTAQSPKSTVRVDVWRRDCASAYDGITYCVELDGDVHVVIIDLNSSHIRFEMVMADDVTSVNTTRRERIEDMVNRSPYQDQEVVVAINADYFGRLHGPEGLTIKNGRRLDDAEESDENPYAVWRSSLAISRLNRISLGRKSVEELRDPRAYRERFYNTVGGGPLILNHGVVIPNSVACPMERFPVGACRRRIQTAAGLSEDGRWLYLAVGQGRDIEGFARLLRDYGAFTGIKLDGGGSSQLWYDGEMRHDADRPVGNALLVFHSPLARHDAQFLGPSDFFVVQPGARIEVELEIRNTGFLDWEPDLGYRFRNVQGWPVLGPAYERLPEPVPAGAVLRSTLVLVAPHRPGVYKAAWQLTRRTEPIGSKLWLGVVVIPAGNVETSLKEKIEAQIAASMGRLGFEEAWLALRGELEREICREMEAEIRGTVHDENGRMTTPSAAVIPEWWESLCRSLPW